MFVILNAVKSERRKIKSSKVILGVKEYFLDSRNKFFVVDVAQTENGVNWRDVKKFLGTHSDKVLFGKNINPPSDGSLKNIDTSEFFNVVLFNTASLLIKNMYLCGLRAKCYVNDPKGNYASLLKYIVKYSAQTVVATENEYKYYPFIRSVYADYGAAVTVSAGVAIPHGNAVVVDTAGGFCSGSALNFSLHGGISPSEIDGLDKLKQLCPPVVDENSFLAAVYSYSNSEFDLSSAFCSHVNMGGTKISFNELAYIAKQKISAMTNSKKSIIFYV